MILKHPTAQRLAYLLCSVFLLLASTAFSVIASEQAPEEKQTLDKVLFVGNSFSFYNNGIHNHLGSLIRAEGNWQRGKNRLRLQTLSGGHIHEQLEGLQATLSNDRLGWQAVVLQAHSNEAVLKSKQARFTSSLKQAIDIVRGHRLEPILFMTWGYKDDPKMSQALAEAYIEQAEKHNVHLVPVGLAFAQAAKALPNVELFVPDVLGIEDTAAGNIITYREEWKHPSVAGTYLAACVFYASLYQKSPLGNPFTAGLDPDVASALQSLSWQIVSDFQSRS
ncbi:DUF4886 domain-containing protein [Glaciecola sp. SC05]|uniref:DUF4886 domain-containing protein n=1 Tax=Glaciecola sp. SC05 TaxID=1987355 RepID=UPI00352955E4